MFNLLIAEGGTSGGGSSSIIMIVVMFAVLLLLPLISYFPNRKRKKAAQEMMKSVRVGKKIRTIGGFVGEIVSLDEKNGTMELNVGTKDAPVIVSMYQGAIDVVLNPDVPVKEQEDAQKVVEADAVTAVTADDAEQDAIAAEKAAEKKAKKDAKKKEKAEKKVANEETNAVAVASDEIKDDAVVVEDVAVESVASTEKAEN